MSDIKRNRKRARFVLAAALPLVLASGVTLAAGEASEMQREDFFAYCASCHGPSGHGDGPVAVELKKRPVDLTQLAKNNNGNFPYARVRAVIDGRGQVLGIHGPADMPVWGERFRQEGNNDTQVRGKILNIVDYLVSIQEK
jgi:mono/diheme cytochrome c family protein